MQRGASAVDRPIRRGRKAPLVGCVLHAVKERPGRPVKSSDMAWTYFNKRDGPGLDVSSKRKPSTYRCAHGASTLKVMDGIGLPGWEHAKIKPSGPLCSDCS
jgi:hypothetical protein